MREKEMNIFTRFVDLINSNINSFLDQAEDPEKMIKLVISKLEDTIVEVRTSCSSAMAAKARTERNMNDLEAEVYRWTERAEKAALKNLDQLALEALAEKKKALAKLDALKDEVEKYEKMIDGYKEDIHKLEEKLANARDKYEKIKAEAQAERQARNAEKQFNRANSGFDRYDRMEERFDRMNAERQARRNTAETERKFREMEEAEELQKELDELKARLNKGDN